MAPVRPRRWQPAPSVCSTATLTSDGQETSQSLHGTHTEATHPGGCSRTSYKQRATDIVTRGRYVY